MTGDLCTPEFRARLDGFRGTVGENGTLAGEPGRLWNVSMVGGMGVLDGRGPRSMGSTGNGLGCTNGGEEEVACRSAIDIAPERESSPLVPVPSVRSLSASISSISSIEGKVWAKSCRLSTDILGEEDVDEDGEGGPRLEVGTSA